MRRWLLAVLVSGTVATLSLDAHAQPTIELYTRSGCPHCAEARDFLAREVRERPELRLVVRDVVRDRAARERLERVSSRAGVRTPGVPTIVVGETVIVGFDTATTPVRVRAALAGGGELAETGAVCGVDPVPCEEAEAVGREVELPLFGRVSLDALGLPLFTLAIGFVDGINPCATWVLLFLLAMLVNLESRARMALIAGTFVVVSGIVYYAFMAAWLTFFVIVGISQPVRLVLAALAIVLGALNVKDFFALGRGPSVGIPEAAKPGIYARARSILRAENVAAAIAGVVVLAFLVNLVELLCTAGLPAVYTAILVDRGLSTWEYHAYLGLYIVAYLVDDAILVTVGVVTLGKRKLQERGGRWLKLVAGTVMLALGVVLVVRPSWLAM